MPVDVSDRYPEETLERFWKKVEVRGPDECWLWQAATNEHGYGIIRINGKNVKAHRVALSRGAVEPPPDVAALHSCDNPPCVNPRHLRWGTQQDNIRDMHERARRVYTRSPKKPKPLPLPRAGRFSR